MYEQKLTIDNYDYSFLRFQSRQAGVSVVFSPERMNYSYNVYCLESKKLTELFSVEHEFLVDALHTVNQEFGSWEIVQHAEKKEGCGSCAAK